VTIPAAHAQTASEKSAILALLRTPTRMKNISTRTLAFPSVLLVFIRMSRLLTAQSVSRIVYLAQMEILASLATLQPNQSIAIRLTIAVMQPVQKDSSVTPTLSVRNVL
jgi:hypothetical protein